MSNQFVSAVAGYCPVGCGMTLVLAGEEWAGEGNVTCSAPDCPRPDAAHAVLQDSETEHVVTFADDHFNVLHPLRERLDGELLDCDLGRDLAALDGPPVEPGTYRATRYEPDAYSEPYRPDQPPWDFERLSEQETEAA